MTSFVDKALELRLVERMIDHPKTAQDVAIYMDDFAVHTKEPELYDVLEPESKESEEVAVTLNHVEQEGREEAKKRFSLRKREEKEEQRPILSPPKLKKIVWGNQNPYGFM